jgi:hypothetical protein
VFQKSSALDKINLSSTFMVPNVNFEAYQIDNLKIGSCPLSKKLLHRNDDLDELFASYQTGFLAMNKDKAVKPLSAHDPEVHSSDLVGIWFYGLDELLKKLIDEYGEFIKPMMQHKLVWAACMRFIYARGLNRKSASSGKHVFLIASFSTQPEKIPIFFFEFKVGSKEDSPHLKDQWVFFNSESKLDP